MDGLECSEINLSSIIDEDINFTMRIDSEYFKKIYLDNERLLLKLNAKTISNDGLSQILGGKRIPKGCSFSDEGIKYCRAEDNKFNFLDIESSPCISNELHIVLKKYTVNYDDILITNVGNGIGDVTINKYKDTVINMTENCAKVCNYNGISPDYIFLYLKSNYGKNQIVREKVGTAQPKLSLERIRQFLIVDLNDKVQIAMARIVNRAYDLLQQSVKIFKDAENVLHGYLNVKFDRLDNSSVSIKLLSDSYLRTGRIDAEYYQVKYDELLEKIKKMDSHKLSNICNIYKDNFIPIDGKIYKYIELADVDNNGNIGEIEEILGSELPTRARRKVEKNQVIISSIEGSLQSCAMILNDDDNILCSNGFFVIDSQIINSETLLILFKNPVIQWQLKRGCAGTILTALPIDEFYNVKVPIIDKGTQNSIKEKISKSFELRKESEELIKKGIRAVEIAIEKSEDEAIKYLESGS